MKKKLISHEVPICMLKDSLEFNDYQYCLVHLLEEDQEYLAHFKKCSQWGNHVLLDNSLFELGVAFDTEKFVKWIKELSPTEYIIPDAFDDMQTTVANAEDWMRRYAELPGKKIGVVQGKTYEEYVQCYKSLDALGVDKIAISFGYPSYTRENPYIDKNQARMFGRITLINRLLNDGVINTSKPHHLLGAGLPQEFMFYKDNKFNFIESLDTSNPIVHGMKGVHYDYGGLIYKDEHKLADQLTAAIGTSKMIIIQANIRKFSKFVN